VQRVSWTIYVLENLGTQCGAVAIVGHLVHIGSGTDIADLDRPRFDIEAVVGGDQFGDHLPVRHVAATHVQKIAAGELA
jgi:hypothetical protein